MRAHVLDSNDVITSLIIVDSLDFGGLRLVEEIPGAEIGDKFVNGVLIKQSLEIAKAQKWEQIKAYRDKRKASGVKVGDHWFHSDDGSRIQQLGLFIMGASVPAVQWKTMSGEFVTMTQTLAAQIFSATAASDQAIFAAAEAHKAAMSAAPNPSSYDFTGGWPLVYGE